MRGLLQPNASVVQNSWRETVAYISTCFADLGYVKSVSKIRSESCVLFTSVWSLIPLTDKFDW